jgi:hypothetical protein
MPYLDRTKHVEEGGNTSRYCSSNAMANCEWNKTEQNGTLLAPNYRIIAEFPAAAVSAADDRLVTRENN